MKQKYLDSVEKVKETLKAGAGRQRVICEVQRELYDFIDEHILDSEIKNKGFDLVAEAFIMGKRISNKLMEYNHMWHEDEWEANPDYLHDLDKRAKRKNYLYRIKSVQFQTIEFCNRKCPWCPNSYMDRSAKNKMSNEVMNRILKELAAHNYKGEIHPFLMGEPLTDNRIISIIQLIKAILPENKIKIITNGDGLTYKQDVQLLLDAGVDTIHVNHYDDTELDKIRDLDFPQVSHFGLKHLLPTFNNRAGKVDYNPDYQYSRCPQFLKKLAFNWKGEMILCCADYNYEVVFGNIMEEPLTMIMDSPLYKEYKKAHVDGDIHHLPVCERCNFVYKKETPIGN